MVIKTVAVLSPGDMGHNFGIALKKAGFNIITCLANRSERTKSLAEKAEFEDVANLDLLVKEADLVLSIMPPSNAIGVAQDVADAMKRTGEKPVFVDCNAISPDSSKLAAASITEAGANYVDGGIVGPGPGTRERATNLYVSGPNAAAVQAINGPHIAVIDLGPEIGKASAAKMCYAAITKGSWTLYTTALVAAEALGVSTQVHEALKESRPAIWSEIERMLPRLPLDAGRWIGEMEEIAQTMGGAGASSHFHQGAAETMELLDSTPIGRETRENYDKSRTLQQCLEIFADHLPVKSERAKAAE
jgi:3-hydroxyisobutyrate dehydrogenase-like beta-hydroxyacid dehydrogenase